MITILRKYLSRLPVVTDEPMALSMDLRVRIYEARQGGETTAEVAERFAVSPAFVRRLMQRHRETGSLASRTARRGPVRG
jgi:transposase